MNLTSIIYLVALFVFCGYALGYGLHEKKKQDSAVPLLGMALVCLCSLALALVENFYWVKR